MPEQGEHAVEILDRKKISLKGVRYVGVFDENEITLDTNGGYLELRGADLHITHLNLDQGELAVEGFINCIEHIEGKTAQRNKGQVKRKSILSRILK